MTSALFKDEGPFSLLSPTSSNKERSSYEIIASEIIKGIYTGRYSPGHRLVEPDLVRQYGFSRSSVREALRQLASNGIVTWSLHKGASVRLLSRSEVIDILLVAEVLMGLSARLTASVINEGKNRSILKKVFEHLMSFRAAGDFYESTIARDRFFHALATISANRELQRALPFVQIQIARVQIRASAVEVAAL